VLDAKGYNIRLDPAAGGGATWDVGCYGVNVARWMLGEPASVYAEATLEGGVDRSVAAVFAFPGGGRAALDYSLAYGRRSFYEILGTKGAIAIENMWQEPDQPAAIYLRTERGLAVEELPPQNHFQLEIEAFSQAVLDGAAAPYPLEDSEKNAYVCAEVLRSIAEGGRLELKTAPE
jgi:D-xylose 1-dehydrogenase (NADP+, D-xylono-1,5-lactone-forming)